MSTAGGRAFLAGLLVGVLAGLWLAGNVELGAVGKLLGEEQSLGEQAREVIEESYFRKVDASRLENASVRGIVQELRKRYDDRFSSYLTPAQHRRFERSTSGHFSGIGLSVREVKRGLRVARVFEDTPAEGAGIREDDVIVAVEGESIAGEPAEAATGRIKGPPGTTVKLRIRRPSSGRARTIDVERAEVQIPAVEAKMESAGGRRAGHVRLLSFNSGAHGELRDEVERLSRRGARGLVLDLRGNTGGQLNEAVLAASTFVKQGVVVTIEGRTHPKRSLKATGGALPRRPMVVLIDRHTASAAEILAAALRDHDLATVVGTTSFGKGTVQEVIGLQGGAALSLTIAEYVTAEGDSLAGQGIKPQIRARDDGDTEADEGLSRALAVLGRKLDRGG